MSTTLSNDKKKQVRLPRRGGICTMKDLRYVFDQLEEIFGFELIIPDVQKAQRVGGGGLLAQLKAAAAESGGAGTDPFYVAPASKVVTSGTLNGSVIPTIGGVSLSHSPAPTLTIGGSGLQVVCLNFSVTLQKDGGYVESYTGLTAATLTVQSSLPTESENRNGSGTYKIALATFYNGTKTAQLWTQSKNVTICDDGSNAGTAHVRLT